METGTIVGGSIAMASATVLKIKYLNGQTTTGQKSTELSHFAFDNRSLKESSTILPVTMLQSCRLKEGAEICLSNNKTYLISVLGFGPILW